MGILETPVKKYAVELQIESICGGIPFKPELLEKHLRRKGLGESAIIEIMKAAVIAGKADEGIEEAANESRTTFLLDENGFYIVPSQIKAMLKEAAVALGTNTIPANRGIKHMMQVAVWVEPERIYLLDAGGQPVNTPTYTGEKAMHVMTAQGPRDTIGQFDVLENVRCAFEIHVADSPNIKVTEKILKEWLALSQKGVRLGAKRPCDYGTFEVTRFEKMK